MANNYAGNASCPTRLPRIQSEGNIPLTAIATGSLDAMECMLYRMGVDVPMFTDETHGGRIHIFNDGGAGPGVAQRRTTTVSYLHGIQLPGRQRARWSAHRHIDHQHHQPGLRDGNLTGWTMLGGHRDRQQQPCRSSGLAVWPFAGARLRPTATDGHADDMTAPAGTTTFVLGVHGLQRRQGDGSRLR